MKISVGGESFQALRQSNGYYVDKSELIYDLVNANNAVTLFTRPRRFGKTLTMSMLESFFSIAKAEDRALFDGLKIMEHSDFCDAWMNKYPVIFITFKDVEGIDFNGAFEMLKSAFIDMYQRIEPILRMGNLNGADSDLIKRLLYKRIGIGDAKDLIKILTRILYTIYGKQVILLIDEYDVPLAKAQ